MSHRSEPTTVAAKALQNSVVPFSLGWLFGNDYPINGWGVLGMWVVCCVIYLVADVVIEKRSAR